MAWDEWEQLKADAAERLSAHMELNHLADANGGGGADTSGPAVNGRSAAELKSNKATWTKAGHDTGLLRGEIKKALGQLSDGQHGLGSTSGCLTAGAQHEVYDSWHRYMTSVSKRCGRMADLLQKVGSDHLKTDDAVRAVIDGMKSDYRDTPPVGGGHEHGHRAGSK